MYLIPEAKPPGLYERGIFVNTVRKGGPADVSGLLK